MVDQEFLLLGIYNLARFFRSNINSFLSFIYNIVKKIHNENLRFFLFYHGFPLRKSPGHGFCFSSLCRSALGLIVHTGHIINRDKGLGVLAVDEVHQLLILAFVHDGNDLVVLFKVVCADSLVHGGTAVQVVDDELPQRFFFFGNNTHPALDAVIEDEMKTASNGQVWYRIEKTTKWIAKNDPVTKEDNYLKLVKDLEEDTPKTEKVEDEAIDESKPKAPPLPSKKENNKNEYKINKNMEGETILKYGEDDTTNLGSKMKPFSSSSSSNGVSINEQVEGVYIKNIKDTTNSDMIKIRKNFSIGNPDRRSGTDSVINQMFT